MNIFENIDGDKDNNVDIATETAYNKVM